MFPNLNRIELNCMFFSAYEILQHIQDMKLEIMVNITSQFPPAYGMININNYKVPVNIADKNWNKFTESINFMAFKNSATDIFRFYSFDSWQLRYFIFDIKD